MAAPKFSPVGPIDDARAYSSPDHVPDPWVPDRPGEIDGFQPSGDRLGAPGPDQGYALHLANRFRTRLVLTDGEHADDAIRGCLGVALRRASRFSRAPVVHDLTIAFNIWGFLDTAAPADLVELRRPLFEGLRHVTHHYSEARVVADMVPERTLAMTPDAVAAAYPARWRELVGVAVAAG
jgi:hypothetical protein